MGTKNLAEILDLISENYEQKNLTKEDLSQIALACLMYSKVEDHYEIKDIKSISFSLNKYDLDFENINDEPIDGDTKDEFRNAFKSDTIFKYDVKKEIFLDDLELYYKSGENMEVFFGAQGNSLKILLGSDNNTFEGSSIKNEFDNYSRSKGAKYLTPTKITIPFSDIKMAYDFMKLNNAKSYLYPAINTSDDKDKKDRVSVILDCVSNGTTLQAFDTFQLSPP